MTISVREFEAVRGFFYYSSVQISREQNSSEGPRHIVTTIAVRIYQRIVRVSDFRTD